MVPTSVSSLVLSLGLWLGGTGCIINTTNSDDGDTENASNTSNPGPTSGGAVDSTGNGTSNGTGNGTGMVDTTAGPGPANDRCEPFCEALVAAACDNGPTLAGCLLTCEALTSAATCDPTAHDYFDCVDGSTITCNGAGDPVAEGCGLDYLEAIGCAVNENPNPAIVAPCEEYCDGIGAAMCPGNGTVDECRTNCLWLGATGTGCDDEWSTYLDCANAATISCLLGFAVAEGCGTEFGGYYDCIDAAGGG